MIAALLSWTFVVELLGLAAMPWTALAFRRSPEHGFAISKVMGLVGFGVVAWLGGWFFDIPLSPGALRTELIVLLAVSLGAERMITGGWFSALRRCGPAIKTAEYLYLGFFILFLIFRSMQPEIFWGEKPMDFTFLNYLIRAESLPPQEPWASGFQLRYYYLGTFFFALLHKVAAVDSAFGFNFAIATVGAMIGSSIFALVLQATNSVRAALWGALAITLLSNLETARLFWIAHQPAGFDLFWASSRLFTSPAFSEYPLWSVLFADLHAHVIGVPIGIAAMACSLAAVDAIGEGDGNPLAILHGVLIGALFGVNAWDCITEISIFILFMLVAIAIARPARFFRRVGNCIMYGLHAAATATLVLLPFKYSMGAGPEAGVNWVLGDFNLTHQLLMHLGQWIIPLFISMAALLLIFTRNGAVHFASLTTALLLGAVPIVLCALLSMQPVVQPAPWGLMIFFAMLLFPAALILSSSQATLVERRSAALAVGALLIMSVVEVFYLMDRMNTIFKFYIPVWSLIGTAGIAMYSAVLGRLGCLRRIIPFVITAIVLLIAAAGTGINVWGMMTYHRVNAPRPTLNGMEYLASTNPDEGYLFSWMRKNIPGTPVVLEAHGNSYAEFTRVSMNTGLPTVLGWDYHVEQRGVPPQEVSRRARAIDEFYSTPSIQRAQDIIDEFKVAYVVVGSSERGNYLRGTYQIGGADKFLNAAEVFKPIFRSGVVVLYATRYADSTNQVKG